MQPTSFNCNRCGAPLQAGVTQCANCGQTFPGPVPYSQAPGVPQQPVKKGSSGCVIAAIVGGAGCLFLVVILAAILFPVFSSAREKAREMSSMSNLKIIGLAEIQYAQDHNEKYPPMESLDNFKSAVRPYIQSQPGIDVFLEPGTNAPYTLNSKMSKKSMADLSDPAGTVLAQESAPHPDGLTAVLYADGHVEMRSRGSVTSGP